MRSSSFSPCLGRPRRGGLGVLEWRFGGSHLAGCGVRLCADVPHFSESDFGAAPFFLGEGATSPPQMPVDGAPSLATLSPPSPLPSGGAGCSSSSFRVPPCCLSLLQHHPFFPPSPLLFLPRDRAVALGVVTGGFAESRLLPDGAFLALVKSLSPLGARLWHGHGADETINPALGSSVSGQKCCGYVVENADPI